MVEEEPLDMEPEIPLPMQEPEMKVRKDYVRQKKGSAARLMQRCPITGQLIAAEEMSNHLKAKWPHVFFLLIKSQKLKQYGFLNVFFFFFMFAVCLVPDV